MHTHAHSLIAVHTRIACLQTFTQGPHTIAEWMVKLALDWKRYEMPDHPGIADYGGFAGDFLECVSTYIHAIPALQAGNAWMLGQLAEMLASQGNTTLARSLAADRALIINATLSECYVRQSISIHRHCLLEIASRLQGLGVPLVGIFYDVSVDIYALLTFISAQNSLQHTVRSFVLQHTMRSFVL